MLRPVATAPRTYLRRPTLADLDEFTAASGASTSLHSGYVHPPATAGDYRQWLQRGDRADNELFLVCRRSDDALCGFTNLNNVIRGALQQAFASWCAFEGGQGSGHLTEGVSLALRLGFTSLRLHRIEANVQPGNERSRSLAVRCGFRLEGYSPKYLLVGGAWRDHERWAINADDWRIIDRRGSTGDT